MTEVLLVCGAITAIGAALVVISKGAKFVLTLIRKVNNFLEDWHGEPARPGVDARPGIPERIALMESEVKKSGDALTNNGGSSVKDAIDRIEKKVDTLQGDFENHVATTLDNHTEASEALEN